MALERSVLTVGTITDLLETHYGLHVDSAEKTALGTANCYRVFSSGKGYFLKEFQSGFSADDLTREAALVNFLCGKGFPAARFIPTVNGTPFFEYRGHLICLEEYIEGTACGYDDFPKSMLSRAAAMLGKLHCAMADYSLPMDMGEAWLSSFSAEKLAAQYEGLIDSAEKRTDDPNRTRIIADLRYKAELAYRCADYSRYYNGITYSPTHGDFQGCQLICGKNASGEPVIRAVIDFSSARTLPVVWEVMRSFVQSSPDCRRNGSIDTKEFCGYVREYMRYFPLTAVDLCAMPYVYLFQLARSKYGYPQYLNTDSEDRNGLLHFAFWRTDICREVEKKAAELSGSLAKLAEKSYIDRQIGNLHCTLP